MSDKPGQLVVVGTGIKLAAHLTQEARAWIEAADHVFYLANSALAATWLKQIRQDAQDLAPLYQKGKERLITYTEMVEQMLAPAREGAQVCAVFYGHPGVFVTPSHEAIRRARTEGIQATMLPGISAEDCLFSDLGIDPARAGCQSYEVTDFLLRPRQFDPSTALVLWQVGVIGHFTAPIGQQPQHLDVLKEVLCRSYPHTHQAIMYEAATNPIHPPNIQLFALSHLEQVSVSPHSTLFVPPLAAPQVDQEMLLRLGLGIEELSAPNAS